MKNTLVDTTKPIFRHTVLGYRKARPGETGPQPIWAQCGGADDDGSGADDGEQEQEGDEEQPDDADDEATEDKGKGGKDSGESTVSQAKYDQIKKHLAEADRKKQAALDELKKLKTKDLPEAEKLKADLDEASTERDTYRDKFTKLARTNAFLMASQKLKVNWNNASTALKVGDFDDLEINDDGSVDGMEQAVKDLAKEHPYLVAKEQSGDEEDGTKRPPKSGSVVGSKNKGKKPEGELSDEDIRKRFPALR